jgi:hypothetical protein
MKKLLLFVAFAVCSLFAVNAQGQFRAGLNAGLPIGDAADGWTFTVQVDAAFLWEVSEDFEAGVITGYSHSFGDEMTVGGFTFEFEDAQFVPVAAAGRFNVSDQFSLGADVGYAVGINDGNDGGFYYRPRVAYGVGENVDIVASYTGISLDGFSFDYVSIGVDFGL